MDEETREQPSDVRYTIHHIRWAYASGAVAGFAVACGAVAMLVQILLGLKGLLQ